MNLALSTYGWIHTAISVVALFSGIAVVAGILASRRLGALTALFMASALATSAGAFGFPGFGPAHIVGVISLALLAVAILARYVYHVEGAWRWIYAVSATFVLYLLVFVTIAEAFKRVPSLYALAPTLTEQPFKSTQLVVLAIFVVLAATAARRFTYVRA